MADWYTPTQVQRALETTWRKLENSTTSLKKIKDEDLLNFYNNKQLIVRQLQYDLYFNTNKLYDPKVKNDSAKSEKEIHNNIFNEEVRRSIPIMTSHTHGHWFTDLEGRPLSNHKRAENKSEYRRNGLLLNNSIGLPKSTNLLLVD